MRLKKIINLFEKGSVSVCGLRGSGKDLLTANVVVRRKKPYVSNINYGGMYMPFNYKLIDCGKNTYKQLLENECNKYDFPYCDGTDVYLSDCGIYFPSQYHSELNKAYPYLPTFMALSRQLGLCSVHTNCQQISAVWNKLREQQQDTYIMCLRSFYIPKIDFVIMKIRIYEKYDSAVARVRPCRVRVPLLNPTRRQNALLYKDDFINRHGEITEHFLFFRNKSTYDTRYFKSLLKGGVRNEENS